MPIFKPLHHCDMIDQCGNYKRTGKCLNHGEFCFKGKSKATENPTPLGQTELALLTGLVELKPQITSKEHGPEPSIRELIGHYYKAIYCEENGELTEQYLKELFNMAS